VRKYAGSQAVVLSIGCGIGRVESYPAPHVKELWASTSAPPCSRKHVSGSRFEISALTLEWGKEGNAEIHVAARAK
jgi:hypothetical protein